MNKQIKPKVFSRRRKIYSIMMTSTVFIILFYIAFHLCAYGGILLADDGKDLLYKLKTLKIDDIVFIAGLGCMMLYFWLSPIIFYVFYRMSRFFSERILNKYYKE